MPERKYPRLYEFVLQAVSKLGEVKGSSVRNITDLVRMSINDNNIRPRPKNIWMLIRKALRHGIEMGHLEKKSGRYKIRVNSSAVGQMLIDSTRKSGNLDVKNNERSNFKRSHQSGKQKPQHTSATESTSRYQTRSRTVQQKTLASKSGSSAANTTKEEGHRVRKAKKSSGKPSVNNRNSRTSRKERQKAPAIRVRKGTPHPHAHSLVVESLAENKWSNVTPFSMSSDWGVEADEDSLSIAEKQSVSSSSDLKANHTEDNSQNNENPEHLVEPSGSSDDLSPDNRPIMANENIINKENGIKDDDNVAENIIVEHTYEDSNKENDVGSVSSDNNS